MYTAHQYKHRMRQVEQLYHTVRRHRLALPRLVREALNRLRPFPTPAAV